MRQTTLFFTVQIVDTCHTSLVAPLPDTRSDVPSLNGLDGFRACPPRGKDQEKLYLKTSGMQSSLRKVKYEKRIDTSKKKQQKVVKNSLNPNNIQIFQNIFVDDFC